jgi:predicted transcriptional regulator
MPRIFGLRAAWINPAKFNSLLLLTTTMSGIELDQLRAFVKVVQAGSFTRAAAVLGSEKAKVSRTISRLEQQLGVRLLERTTRSLRLTEVGREHRH